MTRTKLFDRFIAESGIVEECTSNGVIVASLKGFKFNILFDGKSFNRFRISDLEYDYSSFSFSREVASKLYENFMEHRSFDLSWDFKVAVLTFKKASSIIGDSELTILSNYDVEDRLIAIEDSLFSLSREAYINECSEFEEKLNMRYPTLSIRIDARNTGIRYETPNYDSFVRRYVKVSAHIREMDCMRVGDYSLFSFHPDCFPSNGEEIKRISKGMDNIRIGLNRVTLLQKASVELSECVELLLAKKKELENKYNVRREVEA